MFAIKYILLISFACDVSSKCALKNKQPGKCVPLKDCPSAIRNLKNKELPQTCRFELSYPIVCCPVEVHGTTTERSVGGNVPGKKEMVSARECRGYGSQLKHMYPERWGETDIIGGTNAYPGEFPHMAALGYGESPDVSWNCGGTLISDRFILTAAHCVKSSSLGEVKYVQLGDIKLDSSAETHQNFTVSQIIRHPSYAPPSKYHDIALLQLNRPVKFNSFVKPACLFTEPTLDSIKNFTFEVTGWGLTEFGGSTSDVLQKVSLDLFRDCRPQYNHFSKRLLPGGVLPESQVCAGSRSGKKDSCNGDSGGPLQVFYSTELLHFVVGITSFGQSCATVVPGVYTRVSHYVPWIENIVWPKDL